MPGVIVTPSSTTTPRSTPTDTGVAFLLGLFEKGPAGVDVTLDDARLSLDAFTDLLGGRMTYSVDYDWAETTFREGTHTIIPARVVGPAALRAFSNLAGTAGTALKVEAKTVGEWGNSLKREVVNGPSGGTHRIIIIRDADDVELERTPEFSDRLDAVDWSDGSEYVTITNGAGTGLPVVVASAALASGTDDRNNITITDIEATLDHLVSDLGAGNVAAPNWSTEAVHEAAMAHCAEHGDRFAVLDASDTPTKATLTTAAGLEQGGANSSYGSLWAPWLKIPGTAPGSTGRLVPPSALVCGKAAETDATEGPNQAPAGIFGQARYVTGVNAAWQRTPVGSSDADDLYDAGVNLVVMEDGVATVYGNRTLVDPDGPEKRWLQLSNARYRMSLVARSRGRGKPFVFRKINSSTLGQFRQALEDMLLRDWGNGDLYSDEGDDSPATAFNVDTDTVNDATTAEAGRMLAAVVVRPTKGADTVEILITAAALTEPVA